jgi:dipeptidyl aminopeptidase/acylaminoacyl peptidase
MHTSTSYPIDRYLNVRSAIGPTISADNRALAFLTNISGNFEVWQVPLDSAETGPAWPKQITFNGDRVMAAHYSPTNPNQLLYAADRGGNENAQLFLLELQDGDLVSETPLTQGYENAMHMAVQWLPGGGGIIFAANRRRADRFDLYIQPLDGPPSLVYAQKHAGYLWGLTVAPSGREVVVVNMESSFSCRLTHVDLESGDVTDISPSEQEARYFSPHFSADGKSIYLSTDADSDFEYAAQYNLTTRKLQPIFMPDWNVEALVQSPDRTKLFCAVNAGGESQLFLLNTATGERREAPGFGTQSVEVIDSYSHIAFSADSRHIAFSSASATRTFDIFVWDLETDTIRQMTQSSHGGLPANSFASPQLIDYPTFDDRRIPAWYYPPANSTEPAPCVVLVHGGPEGQSRPAFHFLIQYLSRHGYAILVPNVRGSVGYGRIYSKLDDVRKRMDSVADLAHANLWLREEVGIDSERIVVYGGSYGGFMVLSALTTNPELWAAGVDIVGISSFVTFLENTSAYRRAHREAEYGSLEHDREFLESISPMTHIDNVTAPLMIVHGRNDPRVPVSEAEQLAASLKARGVPVELLIFEDEGHGIIKLKNKRVMYPRVVEFLSRL